MTPSWPDEIFKKYPIWSNPIRQVVEWQRERQRGRWIARQGEGEFGILNAFVCVTWVPFPLELIPLGSED